MCLQCTPVSSSCPEALHVNDIGNLAVAVRTPDGTSAGDSGVLRLIASVGPPIGVIDSDVRELFVRTTGEPPRPATVTFTQESPVITGDLTNAAVGTALRLEFTFNFNVLQGPQTRNFRSRIEISSAAAEVTLFRIQFGPTTAFAIDTGASTDQRKESLAYPVTHGASTMWRVVITPLAGSLNKAIVFKATVESVADGIKCESDNLTISVTR